MLTDVLGDKRDLAEMGWVENFNGKRDFLTFVNTLFQAVPLFYFLRLSL